MDNEIGKKYNKLKVLAYVNKVKYEHVYLFKCDCGSVKNIILRYVKRNQIKSCGCRNTGIKKLRSDLVLLGQKIGKLTVIKKSNILNNQQTWDCLCSCGNSITTTTAKLRIGRPKSCGCSLRDTMLKEYGVFNATQNAEIALKQAKSANKITDLKHWKTKDLILCQGSYEVAVINWLNINKIDYKWQISFRLSNNKYYRCDLFLVKENKYVEIKGYFRKDALEKWVLFTQDYPNSELWDKSKLKELKIL